ncbi:hypothetical protein [Pandoraea sp. NPDC087047]
MQLYELIQRVPGDVCAQVLSPLAKMANMGLMVLADLGRLLG